MSQPATQMTLEALRSVPLFASLDDAAAKELRSLLSDKKVPQNTRLFKQGDKGDDQESEECSALAHGEIIEEGTASAGPTRKYGRFHHVHRRRLARPAPLRV